ncbi:GNAT family N-acetyltransferase [Vibrio sp. B1FLJ16]|uniref:GNAT family N-acetyltransferase n=1 Tax=Vibrio sp. B1FLJ16 TaxID=2751178 RepID=UPI0015F681DC|nr:GNAT family protein [Vibrio sp. B1FLJ16]CAD7823658.1 COG1670 Acetyltransferases [Vibrio sp. B1FLJ16]CAE6952495.1 COG1670 Acetyltransferases [Vibrio sp. B1FLJ16]
MSIYLTTTRTKMTPINECDWPLFQRLHTEPDIIALCFDAPDAQQLKEKFASRLPIWTPDDEQWLCLVIRDSITNQPIGITGFSLQNGVAEVGYLLLPEFHGKQLGTETLKAVINWAHIQHQIRQFSATVTEGNIASERVLEKCGFSLKRIIPDAYEISGKRYADKIYSLQHN